MTPESFDRLCRRTQERFLSDLDTRQTRSVQQAKEAPTASRCSDRLADPDLSDAALPGPRTGKESIISILLGYCKQPDGAISIVLPAGRDVADLAKTLNAEAEAAGLSKVFYETRLDFWQENESDPSFAAEPGVVYQFRIIAESLGKARDEQERDHGPLVPLAVLALAEACERYATSNQGSLFEIDGRGAYVRGATPGVALGANNVGVYVKNFADDGVSSAACAAMVLPRAEA